MARPSNWSPARQTMMNSTVGPGSPEHGKFPGAWHSSVSPLLDQWEHVAVVYDGTNLTFYLNGGEANGGVASQAVTAALVVCRLSGIVPDRFRTRSTG